MIGSLAQHRFTPLNHNSLTIACRLIEFEKNCISAIRPLISESYEFSPHKPKLLAGLFRKIQLCFIFF